MLTRLKPPIIALCIFLLLLVLTGCKISSPPPGEDGTLTEQQKQLVRELNRWLIPLGSSPLDLTDNELSFLDGLKEAKIVALGEATHGTREFFQMKHRILQYLVKYYRHKAIGFEADFAESIYINNYVTRGEGDLEELMGTVMQYWSLKTGEISKQAFIVLYHLYNGYGGTNWRDRFMAENARWIAGFFGQDTKITLWAHNGHIARDPGYDGGPDDCYRVLDIRGHYNRIIYFDSTNATTLLEDI
jgi:erythromycin esterase-like protein